MADKNSRKNLIISGFVLALSLLTLAFFGNSKPGFSLIESMVEITGAIKLHKGSLLSYFRPEFFAIIAGSFLMSLYKKDFNASISSSPISSFFIGVAISLASSLFLLGPVKIFAFFSQRELAFIPSLPAYIVGVYIAILMQKRTYRASDFKNINPVESYYIPVISVILTIMIILKADFFEAVLSRNDNVFYAKPILASLIGLFIGAALQRGNFCMVSNLREFFVEKKIAALFGILSFMAVFFVFSFLNLKFINIFTFDSIIARDYFWFYLNAIIIGFGFGILRKGPIRLLISAGEGESNSIFALSGIFITSTLVENFNLYAKDGQILTNSKVFLIISLMILISISTFYLKE